MSLYWNADLDSARWSGADLKFEAATDHGRVEYVIRSRHLRNAVQRTGSEALSINLPGLRNALCRLADAARPGTTLTLD